MFVVSESEKNASIDRTYPPVRNDVDPTRSTGRRRKIGFSYSKIEKTMVMSVSGPYLEGEGGNGPVLPPMVIFEGR